MTLACNELTGDFSDVIALEYTGPPTPRIEEGDTLRLTARVLDLRGDSLPDVPVVWHILEVDSVQVGFTLDTLTGLITATAPGGPWRVQARADELRTDPPINVTVVAAPDSIAGPDSTRVTVALAQTVSDLLATTVLDLTTNPGVPSPLGGVPVVYQLVDPTPGSAAADGVALGLQGAVGDEPHRVDATTLPTGQALVTVNRVGSVQPDSVIVDATAFTAQGLAVAGSPVRFIVLFLNN